MRRINWTLSYSARPLTPWRWSLIGTYADNGETWAHYLFSTKPNARMQRRTKRGRTAAVLYFSDFLTDEANA